MYDLAKSILKQMIEAKVMTIDSINKDVQSRLQIVDDLNAECKELEMAVIKLSEDNNNGEVS